jgi:hypothetical protein
LARDIYKKYIGDNSFPMAQRYTNNTFATHGPGTVFQKWNEISMIIH